MRRSNIRRGRRLRIVQTIIANLVEVNRAPIGDYSNVLRRRDRVRTEARSPRDRSVDVDSDRFQVNPTGNTSAVSTIKSLWAYVQGDPVFMRRVNGWFTIFGLR